ncbi:O-acyltransferase WSD1-like [Quillaja saponaria]|uniref:O-acyltransferase WSD1-like n=1 Tax=Quillaja saponaria TaxID=32244 RepID=A0AAD7PPA9_QUISA|nr:O-acyltransferase WSD1-like [Quillaja saponaria]
MDSEVGLWLRKRFLKPIETKRAYKVGGQEEEEEQQQQQPLSPAARLFHEPNFNVYNIAIMGWKTKMCPEVVKGNLVHTLLKHPRFSSLQVTDENGEMKWVHTRVDLDMHVIVPDVNPNMDSPDQSVEDYISDLSKTHIDKSQPLWDVHILNLKTSNAESTSIFRIHHSLGDGTSLISLLLACTRQTADPEALPTIPVKKQKKQHKEDNSNTWKLLKWFVGFWWVVKLFWNTFIDVFMFMLTALFLKDTDTPIKEPPGLEFTPRRFVYRIVSLDDMKLIKNAMNMTINDVALGITQAGLSCYLNRRYGEQSTEKEEGATSRKVYLPEKIRLRSTLYINIRPSAGIQALADMMKKNTEAKWGNKIGYVLLPFTIAIRDDPLDYIHEAKATIDRKKNSLEAIFTFYIAELVVKIFGIKWASALYHRIITHTTMCFTNLAGPLEEIGFYGHPMAFLPPSCYGELHSLVVMFQSYINKMTIVLSVDEGTIPDPHRLCDDIVESLKLVKDAVVERGLVKENQEHK